MRQVLQDARSGQIEVAEVPLPKLLPGCVLVQIKASLVSPGTERASSEFAKKNLLQKANARPDLVREVVAKFRRDGFVSTLGAVQSRLARPAALGYSSAGTVVAVADDVLDLRVGDHVACAGAGYAVHAEFACVPRLLVAKAPADAEITSEEAAFTTIGAVALHGLRTADVKLGDVVGVIGLGLLGQLSVQLLKAAGCRVIGLDLQEARARLAIDFGAEDATDSRDAFSSLCSKHSASRGVDAVLITAETASNDPVNLAAEVSRDRGVVVAVGTVGLELERKLYYSKELDFRVSRSYGPGRYDSAFEQKGIDYPIGYVRWTETRNMEAFLRLLAERKIDVRPLVTHRFPVEDALLAYECINRTTPPALGVLITYPDQPAPQAPCTLLGSKIASRPASVSVGVLGAGNFAMTTLLPALLTHSETRLTGICSANGSNSRNAGSKFGFQYCTSDENDILTDPGITTVVIATRNHLHATQVAAALRAGKHVFCEKPLCINETELGELLSLYRSLASAPLLSVGFNRRFAPMSLRMRDFLRSAGGPLTMHYRINAGFLPANHWINDPEQGGGRIIGEVCHFVDFLSFLSNSVPVVVDTQSVGCPDPSFVITVCFADGSHGTISYLTAGDRSYSKERLEVFGAGCTAVLEDFRSLELIRNGRRTTMRSRLFQDKGHRAEWHAFANAIRRGEESPISFETIVISTLATLRAMTSRGAQAPMSVNLDTLNVATNSVDDNQTISGALKLETC